MIAGDVVNTAARLQAAAPVNGILVGEETHAATHGVIAYEPAPPVIAKGKAEPLRAWLALRARSAGGRASPVGASARRAGARAGDPALDLAADDRGAPPPSRHDSRRGRRREDAARRRVRRDRLRARRQDRPRTVAALPGQQRLRRVRGTAEAADRDLRERLARGRAGEARQRGRDRPSATSGRRSPGTSRSCSGSTRPSPCRTGRRSTSRSAASWRRSQPSTRRSSSSRTSTGATRTCSTSSRC